MKHRDADLFALKVPISQYEVARRRVEEITRHYARVAQSGSLDLSGLSTSAYLQGVWDGVQLAKMRPEVLTEG